MANILYLLLVPIGAIFFRWACSSIFPISALFYPCGLVITSRENSLHIFRCGVTYIPHSQRSTIVISHVRSLFVINYRGAVTLGIMACLVLFSTLIPQGSAPSISKLICFTIPAPCGIPTYGRISFLQPSWSVITLSSRRHFKFASGKVKLLTRLRTISSLARSPLLQIAVITPTLNNIHFTSLLYIPISAKPHITTDLPSSSLEYLIANRYSGRFRAGGSWSVKSVLSVVDLCDCTHGTSYGTWTHIAALRGQHPHH